MYGTVFLQVKRWKVQIREKKGAVIDGGMRNKREMEEQEWQQEIVFWVFFF